MLVHQHTREASYLVIAYKMCYLENRLWLLKYAGDLFHEFFIWPNLLRMNCFDFFQTLGKQVSDYQTTIAELNDKVESLRADGQTSQAEDILRLTSQYELLIDQVNYYIFQI